MTARHRRVRRFSVHQLGAAEPIIAVSDPKFRLMLHPQKRFELVFLQGI
jgi:hypothetical protein